MIADSLPDKWGHSQFNAYLRDNHIPVKYWYRKYKNENGLSVEENEETTDAFIPVEVSGDRRTTVGNEGYGRIEVSFPNGVQLNCPAGIDIGQLKTLINF